MNRDYVIIGAGLAGCTLAWQLKWHGQHVTIVDRDDAVTASKVAAGLINPITGKRLAVQSRFHEFRMQGYAFYRRVEDVMQSTFLYSPGMIRILKDDHERKRFQKRSDVEFQSIISVTFPPLPDGIDAKLGSFRCLASRIDVNRFLEMTRVTFSDCIQYRAFHTDEIDPDRVYIFCTGIAAMSDFPANCFQPAKGELLTIRIPGLAEARILNQGVWLMPIGDEHFRVGATYSWKQLDSIPTEEAKTELIHKLEQFLKLPFEVLEHQAATRPILTDRTPMLGTLPGKPRIAVFNGLGSKGALMAPFYSQQLAEHLVSGTPIDAEVDVKRFYNQNCHETPLRNCS